MWWIFIRKFLTVINLKTVFSGSKEEFSYLQKMRAAVILFISWSQSWCQTRAAQFLFRFVQDCSLQIWPGWGKFFFEFMKPLTLIRCFGLKWNCVSLIMDTFISRIIRTKHQLFTLQYFKSFRLSHKVLNFVRQLTPEPAALFFCPTLSFAQFSFEALSSVKWADRRFEFVSEGNKCARKSLEPVLFDLWTAL